jgi:hypothetical protein
MKYSDIKFSDRDILLFSGKGWISGLIAITCCVFRFRFVRDYLASKLSKRKWTATHVGEVVIMTTGLADMLLLSNKIKRNEHYWFLCRVSEPYLFESTTFTFEGVTQKGVRLVSLSDIVSQYKGKIVWRKLKRQTPWTEAELLKYYEYIVEHFNKPYEKHLTELVGAASPWHFGNNNFEDFFCSELIAKDWLNCGLIKNWQASEYSPESFRLGGTIDKELKYTREPACLGEEVEVSK